MKLSQFIALLQQQQDIVGGDVEVVTYDKEESCVKPAKVLRVRVVEGHPFTDQVAMRFINSEMTFGKMEPEEIIKQLRTTGPSIWV